MVPFRNLSAKKEDDYLAEGFTEDLVNELSLYRTFETLSRTATFRVSNGRPDDDYLSATFKVTQAISGILRRDGDRIRVNVDLRHLASGRQIWTERFDGRGSSLFDVQDEVISRLAGGLQIPLESRPSRCQINPQAYDLFLRGRHAYFRYGPKHFAEALGHFQSASNTDTDFAEALVYQSYCRTTMHVFSMPGGDPTLDQALSSAERSVALASGAALTHARLGWVRGFLDRPDKTVDAFEKAISLDQGSAEVNHSFGETLNRLARPADALCYLNRAFELESFAPASWDWCRGHSNVLLKDYEKALDRILPVLELVPGLVPAWVQLARLYAETGEIRQARLVVDRLRAVSPKFGIDHAKRMFPYPSEIERKRLISGLKEAGLD